MKIFCFAESNDERHDRLYGWHPFFALWPRLIGRCLHVGWIERKLHPCYDGWDAEYRELNLENYP